MSLRAFVVGAAAALLASNSNILTHEMIRDEINALPQNWLIPLVSIYYILFNYFTLMLCRNDRFSKCLYWILIMC